MRGRLVVLLMLAATGGLRGQESDRRWALHWVADIFDKPVLTQRSVGVSTGNGSSAFALTGEYYLRDKWSLQAGYFRKEVSYGSASRQMEGLQAGTRCYFLHPDFIIQPYLSATAELNWSRHVERSAFGGSGWDGEQSYSYTGTQHSVNPRLSLAPGAGVELYLFSSIAFTVEYSLHAGLDSRTEITLLYDGFPPQVMRDKGMFHSLSMGAKVTFPFSFTSDDGASLLYMIMELLLTPLDRYNRFR
ncbi:MAG: hypothetical protein LBS42_02995 [Tannerella sp.]|jgi:hypothetical protein|nr:hypothetical protein [Tannerella sp.]